MRAVRKRDDEIQKKEIKEAKKYGTVHQFIVLSRKIGVEMVPGWIARRSRMFVAW